MSHSSLRRLILANDPDAPTSLDRRGFLKASLAAAGSLLLSSQSWAATPGSGGKVVVIGAGFGGLAAAFEAHHAGLDVTVVDARKRVGGRVVSLTDAGVVHEGGAELIGSIHAHWVGYAERFGLGLSDFGDDDGDMPMMIDGRLLSAREANKMWKGVDPLLKQLTKLAKRVDGQAPWLAPDAAKLDAQSLLAWVQGMKASDDAKRLFAGSMSADAGVDAAEQSLLGMLSTIAGGGGKKYWTESESHRCIGGNQQLAVKLAEGIGMDRVLLGNAAVGVTYSDTGATVTLADGTVLECDAVVCAVPSSVWGKITFDPPLPAGFAPRMGTAMKYMTKLKRAVWHDNKLSPDAYTTGLTSLTWDGTDGQSTELRWLVAFSGGKQAEQVMALADDKRDDAFTAELEKVYPGYTEASLEHRFYGWPREEWTGGGYSCPAVGEATTAWKSLREGLGRLHFAGEHCSSAFPGYMEGALETGARVGRTLAGSLS